ncbi:MAG: hypothetical protein ACOY82_08605 [Pseudomonadota bacterium]
MTIDRLSSLSAHIAALRAEMSRKSGESARKRDTEDVDAAAVPVHGAKRDSDELRKQLAEIARDVGIEDADAMDRARGRVVKAVLLWEFGPELREHAEWQPMVNSIADTLAADDRFRNVFNRLIADLQA